MREAAPHSGNNNQKLLSHLGQRLIMNLKGLRGQTQANFVQIVLLKIKKDDESFKLCFSRKCHE